MTLGKVSQGQVALMVTGRCWRQGIKGQKGGAQVLGAKSPWGYSGR